MCKEYIIRTWDKYQVFKTSTKYSWVIVLQLFNFFPFPFSFVYPIKGDSGIIHLHLCGNNEKHTIQMT